MAGANCSTDRIVAGHQGSSNNPASKRFAESVCSSFFLLLCADLARFTLDRQVGPHHVTRSQIRAGENHMLVHLTVVGAALSLLGVWAVCTAVLFYYRRHKIEPVEPGTEAPPAVTKGHAAS